MTGYQSGRPAGWDRSSGPAGPGAGGRAGVAEQGSGVRLAVLATLLFSTSAVLVRLATGLGPLQVASYRLILGAVFVALIAGVERSERLFRPGRAPEIRPILGAGLAAALHFAFYIGSLYRTTIAHALVLVNLSPLLTMPLAAAFLGERFDVRRLPGALIAIAGLGIMVGLEPGLTRAELGGDVMAFLAALAYAVYSLIGRSQRTRTKLLTYTFWVYLAAGLLLLPLAVWGRVTPFQPGPPLAAGPALPALAVWAVVLLALGPTAGGHTLYNAALRRTDAVTVNLITTQEVTGGVLLGWLLLGETPSIQAVVGGLVALGGLVLALGPRSPVGRPPI